VSVRVGPPRPFFPAFFGVAFFCVFPPREWQCSTFEPWAAANKRRPVLPMARFASVSAFPRIPPRCQSVTPLTKGADVRLFSCKLPLSRCSLAQHYFLPRSSFPCDARTSNPRPRTRVFDVSLFRLLIRRLNAPLSAVVPYERFNLHYAEVATPPYTPP